MTSKIHAVLDDGHQAAAANAQLAGQVGFNNGGKLVMKWSVQEVCDWLSSIGYNEYVPLFQKHFISGAVLPKLTDLTLEKMGMDCVGKRLLLVNEMVKIQALARAQWRNEVLWAGEQYRPGPCNDSLPFGFPLCFESCTGRPDTYTVTNAKLNVTASKKNVNTPCTGFCGFSIVSSNSDLSKVLDVDIAAATSAIGDPLGRVVITTTTGGELLFLRSSECQKIGNIIINAKEEATGMIGLTGGQALTMAR